MTDLLKVRARRAQDAICRVWNHSLSQSNLRRAAWQTISTISWTPHCSPPTAGLTVAIPLSGLTGLRCPSAHLLHQTRRCERSNFTPLTSGEAPRLLLGPPGGGWESLWEATGSNEPWQVIIPQSSRWVVISAPRERERWPCLRQFPRTPAWKLLEPVQVRGGSRCYGIIFLWQPRMYHQKALLDWSLFGDSGLKSRWSRDHDPRTVPRLSLLLYGDPLEGGEALIPLLAPEGPAQC